LAPTPTRTARSTSGTDNSNTSDLTINALIGTGAITKTGNGTMNPGDEHNTYTGSTDGEQRHPQCAGRHGGCQRRAPQFRSAQAAASPATARP